MPSSSGVARGDFNGDGASDLAVGVPFEDVGSAVDAGAVNIIYGTVDGLKSAGNQFWSQSSAGVSGGSETGDQFGRSLASGDFNGDHISDLAIGVPGENLGDKADAGRVVVLYGSASGLATTKTQSLNSFPAAGENFGWSLAWGDFNGDNVGDLAVGAPNADVGGAVDAGQVAFYRGVLDDGLRFDFPLAEKSFETIFQFGFSETSDRFGETLAAGDFDGDDISDLAIGVPHENLGGFGDIFNAGQVYIVHGSTSGILISGSDRDRLQQSIGDRSSDEREDTFGWSLVAADFSGDGFDDLAVGVPGEDLGGGSDSTGPLEGSRRVDAGMIMVYPGSRSGLQRNLRFCFSQDSGGVPGADEDGDQFGYTLAAGDFNGDGLRDLAIGAPFEDVITSTGANVQNAGAVFVLPGEGIHCLTSTGSKIWHQAQGWGSGTAEAGDRFGMALASWNFGRGSQADLVIGVPFEELFTIPDVGMIHVLYGSSTGLTTTGNQFWHQGNLTGTVESDDRFGSALY
jgi:hypothetical protein